MVVVTLVGLVYCCFLTCLIVGMIRSLRTKPSSGIVPSVSVVVAFRNESAGMAGLLSGLSAQRDIGYELILVNDHSEDDSAGKAKEWISQTGVQATLVRCTQHGKKAALTEGIRMARHPVIVTTDADCVHDSEWLVQTTSWFTDPKVQMVVGAVRLHPVVGLWQEMERAEFSVLQATGCATLGYGIPTLCNGANLAFRKEAFDRVRGYEGYEHLAGGDDQVLMKKIGSVWPGGIWFNAQPHTVASTPPQHQIIEFLRQRIRWAAKWRHQSSWAVALALLIATGNAGFLVIQIQTVLAPTPASVGLLSVKLILEWVLLARIGRFLSQPFPAVAFLIWQLLYPAYAVTMGLLVQILPFAWKGRQYFG